MKAKLSAVAPFLLMTACGDAAEVNPPTEPATAVTDTAGATGSATPGGSTAPMMPGAGPASFVGRWSADVSWCAAPTGDGRPIEITTTRFEGYENRCDITAISQTGAGYDASLRCEGEGQTSIERVRMVVSGQTLNLTYLDRSGEPVTLTKCTTLSDTTNKAPALPMP